MARYASSQGGPEFSALPTRCWVQSRPRSHRDTGAWSIPGHTSKASPQTLPPAKDCNPTTYCGKLCVYAFAKVYSARLDSALTACFEASVTYSASMLPTGSSQPRREVTAAHPAASREPRPGSIRIRSSAFDSAAWLWRTTNPALSVSRPLHLAKNRPSKLNFCPNAQLRRHLFQFRFYAAFVRPRED